jgi:phosphoribosylanthranilate isomerase
VKDAETVRDAGADALGVIFAASKRHVDADVATEIVEASEGIVHVGVFRDNDTRFVLDMTEASGVEIVQIHGPLDPDLLEELRARRRGVIKALAVGSEEFFDFDETSVDAVLVDGLDPGSGLEHSWDAVVGRPFAVPVIAAGGLRADNVSQVIALVRPWGVDVATGVESTPGVKDALRVASFVQVAAASFGPEGTT